MSLAPSSLTFKVIENFFSSLDCPRSLTCWILFKENEHDQLVSLSVDPNGYSDSESFRNAYLATKFLSKATFLSTTVDKKELALIGFFETELACAEINKRGFRQLTIKSKLTEWLHYATIRKIDSILGNFHAEEFADLAGWGPGVSLDVKGEDTSPVNKFRLDTGITQSLDNFVSSFIAAAYPIWNLQKRKIHKGNKVVTVPKNSKIDRTIAIEPGLNLWFQKAMGNAIGRRLFRCGVDLTDQTRNQRLSRLGSKVGNLATVDFKSASDSISCSTVEALLPPRWFTLLDLVRSTCGSVSDTRIKYEKFSSMGNGFTFQLESLIFYALALVVCDYLHLPSKEVSVFGDDVIIPKRAFDLYVSVCAFYGFTVNLDKSYSSGYFRESCGSHYFDGIDCKPYFLKEVITGDVAKYKVANGIRRLSFCSISEHCDKRFFSVWLLLRNAIRKPYLISEGYGDCGLIVNFDESHASPARHGIEGYYVRTFAFVPLWYESDDHPVLLARLKGRSVEFSFKNKTNFRSRVKKVKKRLLIHRWTNLGPWF